MDSSIYIQHSRAVTLDVIGFLLIKTSSSTIEAIWVRVEGKRYPTRPEKKLDILLLYLDCTIETKAPLRESLTLSTNQSLIPNHRVPKGDVSQNPYACLTQKIKLFTAIFPLPQCLDLLLQSLVEPASIPASLWDHGMSVTVLSFPRLLSCTQYSLICIKSP